MLDKKFYERQAYIKYNKMKSFPDYQKNLERLEEELKEILARKEEAERVRAVQYDKEPGQAGHDDKSFLLELYTIEESIKQKISETKTELLFIKSWEKGCTDEVQKFIRFKLFEADKRHHKWEDAAHKFYQDPSYMKRKIIRDLAEVSKKEMSKKDNED